MANSEGLRELVWKSIRAPIVLHNSVKKKRKKNHSIVTQIYFYLNWCFSLTIHRNNIEIEMFIALFIGCISTNCSLPYNHRFVSATLFWTVAIACVDRTRIFGQVISDLLCNPLVPSLLEGIF